MHTINFDDQLIVAHLNDVEANGPRNATVGLRVPASISDSAAISLLIRHLHVRFVMALDALELAYCNLTPLSCGEMLFFRPDHILRRGVLSNACKIPSSNLLILTHSRGKQRTKTANLRSLGFFLAGVNTLSPVLSAQSKPQKPLGWGCPCSDHGPAAQSETGNRYRFRPAIDVQPALKSNDLIVYATMSLMEKR
jgi:hypothetical protein